MMTDEREVAQRIVREAKTIAVLGMKGDDEPTAPASHVPKYLAANGYRITPVNPKLAAAGYPGAVATLAELPERPDVVQLFRRSEAVADHVEELLELRPPAVWMQTGVRNGAAAERLESAGITVIQDRCMHHEHQLLGAGE